MSKEPLRYLRTSRLQSLPHDFHIVDRFHVERLNLEEVEAIFANTEDMTSLQTAGPWREKTVSGFIVWFKDGRTRYLSPDHMKLSETGGEFFEVAENGLHRYPLTEFCHRLQAARERRAEAEERFLDWY